MKSSTARSVSFGHFMHIPYFCFLSRFHPDQSWTNSGQTTMIHQCSPCSATYDNRCMTISGHWKSDLYQLRWFRLLSSLVCAMELKFLIHRPVRLMPCLEKQAASNVPFYSRWWQIVPHHRALLHCCNWIDSTRILSQVSHPHWNVEAVQRPCMYVYHWVGKFNFSASISSPPHRPITPDVCVDQLFTGRLTTTWLPVLRKRIRPVGRCWYVYVMAEGPGSRVPTHTQGAQLGQWLPAGNHRTGRKTNFFNYTTTSSLFLSLSLFASELECNWVRKRKRITYFKRGKQYISMRN